MSALLVTRETCDMGYAQESIRSHDVLSTLIQGVRLNISQSSGKRLEIHEEQPTVWPYTGADMVFVMYMETPAVQMRRQRKPETHMEKLFSAHMYEGAIECYVHRLVFRDPLEKILADFAHLLQSKIYLSIDMIDDHGAAHRLHHQMVYHVRTFTP